jgi:O-antigen/teichoic acid export membrane protein
MLVVFGERLVTLLYGATFHFERSTLLLIGAVPPLTSLVNILGNALRAREEPEGVFWSTIGAVAVAGTIGIASVALMGVDGAIIGMVSSGVVQVGVMLWLLSRDPSHASAMPASDPRIVGDAVA